MNNMEDGETISTSIVLCVCGGDGVGIMLALLHIE